jgi:chaperonin cofactor prefoldin
MKGKVIISIDDYNRLRDAEDAFLKIHDHPDGITICRHRDKLGSFYSAITSNEAIKDLDDQITSYTITINKLKAMSRKVKNENESLKKEIAEYLRVKKPWYKRIFKSRM